MPRKPWLLLVKGAVGFLLGLTFWWTMAAPYARVLAFLTEPLIRIAERPPVTRLIARDTELTVDRTDFPRKSARPGLRLMDLTANVILMTALFAASRKPFSDRNVGGLFLASLALVVVHVAAVTVNIHSIYAMRLGPWSDRHYGVVARNFWTAAAHFYELIGAFGAAFALWWLFRPSAVPPANVSSHRRRAARA